MTCIGDGNNWKIEEGRSSKNKGYKASLFFSQNLVIASQNWNSKGLKRWRRRQIQGCQILTWLSVKIGCNDNADCSQHLERKTKEDSSDKHRLGLILKWGGIDTERSSKQSLIMARFCLKVGFESPLPSLHVPTIFFSISFGLETFICASQVDQAQLSNYAGHYNTPLNALRSQFLLEIQNQEYLNQPQRMKMLTNERDPNKLCWFHKDSGMILRNALVES